MCDKEHLCPLATDTRVIAEAVQMGFCLFALVASPPPPLTEATACAAQWLASTGC